MLGEAEIKAIAAKYEIKNVVRLHDAENGSQVWRFERFSKPNEVKGFDMKIDQVSLNGTIEDLENNYIKPSSLLLDDQIHPEKKQARLDARKARRAELGL